MKICKSCGGTNNVDILNFGQVALAGDFLNKEELYNQKKYTLEVMFCEDCALFQVKSDVPPKVLFENYFYSSSAIKTLVTHYKNYATEIVSKFGIDSKSKVLEIGCNDGVLLSPLSDLGISNLVGIDPAKNILKNLSKPHLKIINDFFSYRSSNSLLESYGKFDYIIANNVFAHISDINDFVKGVQNCLDDEGVYIFEVHDIDSLIEDIQFDMIYHEHIYYYSLLSISNLLIKHNMRVFDIKQVDTHAGSIRYYACHNESKHIQSEKCKTRIDYEFSKGYASKKKYIDFSNNVIRCKENLVRILQILVKNHKKIIGYGASGRASTLSQFCGVDTSIINVTIDDSPLKHGFYTPGCHYEILSKESIKLINPDYILLYAWSFKDEIISRNLDFLENGGVFIIPLPKIKFILKRNGNILEIDSEDYLSELILNA
jgi:methylation protein EvaC